VSLEVIEVFSRYSVEYDSWYKTPYGRAVLESEANLLNLLLPSGVGLDLGSGTGVFAEKLALNREIVCLDPTSEMLVLAKSRCQHSVLAVGEHPPLRVGSLDFIYAVTVLEFLENPLEMMVAVKGLLKPNGRLVLLSIEKNSPWGRMYAEIAEKGTDPVISMARLYTLSEVEEYLKTAGYKVYERAFTLDYEPLTTPSKPPRLYIGEYCSSCGVFAVVATPT
jgi:ubiquinone/menaquinone biosynthesis C-methylase UbiE